MPNSKTFKTENVANSVKANKDNDKTQKKKAMSMEEYAEMPLRTYEMMRNSLMGIK